MISVPGDMSTGLEISKWLKEKGYSHPIDFNWRTDSKNKQVVFVCINEKLETMIALRWS
jgi:hypothetical protein